MEMLRVEECLRRHEAVQKKMRDILSVLAKGDNPLKRQPQDEQEILSDLAGLDTETQQRLRSCCHQRGLTSWRFVRAPGDYYDWTLEQRRTFLRAPSTDFLCKSMLMVNSRCVNSDWSDRANSKYYLVIVYNARLNKERMAKFVQGLKNREFGNKKYNFRVASEDQSDLLSGFLHNSVTPIGFKTRDIPIIVDEPIAQLPFMWLGGGETDVKWATSLSEFKQAFNPFIGTISRST